VTFGTHSSEIEIRAAFSSLLNMVHFYMQISYSAKHVQEKSIGKSVMENDTVIYPIFSFSGILIFPANNLDYFLRSVYLCLLGCDRHIQRTRA
jgi:hypothetical protein